MKRIALFFVGIFSVIFASKAMDTIKLSTASYLGQSATPSLPDPIIDEVIKVVVAVVSAVIVQWLGKLFKKGQKEERNE